VIFRGNDGKIRELRIFKNPGRKDNGFNIFSPNKTDPSTQNIASIKSNTGEGIITQSLGVPSKTKKPDGQDQHENNKTISTSIENPLNESRKQTGLAEFVRGEKALNDSIWVYSRMVAYRNMIEQEKIRSEQIASSLTQKEAVTRNMSRLISISTASQTSYPNGMSSAKVQTDDPNTSNVQPITMGESEGNASINPLYIDALRYYKGLEVSKFDVIKRLSGK